MILAYTTALDHDGVVHQSNFTVDGLPVAIPEGQRLLRRHTFERETSMDLGTDAAPIVRRTLFQEADLVAVTR